MVEAIFHWVANQEHAYVQKLDDAEMRAMIEGHMTQRTEKMRSARGSEGQ